LPSGQAIAKSPASFEFSMKRTLFLATLCAAIFSAGCKKQTSNTNKSISKSSLPGPHYAFIINNPSPFWSYAKAGLMTAEKDQAIPWDFQSPNTGTVEEQNRLLEAIIQKKDQYKGVAISPLDPKNQTEILNKVAAVIPLICHDSDAPESKRQFYVGTNNVEAGKLFGQLIKEKMPEGGEFALFVGSLDALNAKHRRQGILQELSDGQVQDAPNGAPVTLGKWTLVESATDNTDRSVAQQNVAATLRRHPNLKAVGGLWSYNSPQCLEALKAAGKLGQVKVFAFDEEEATLDAIAAGHCEGTVVQQPYEFGRQSMITLKAIASGEAINATPEKVIPVPAVIVKKDEVQSFREKLAKLRATAEGN
jgi:ribose transport system substrate-binding protein